MKKIAAAITTALFLATVAMAAEDILVDGSKHQLPSHKLDWHDTLDVVNDPIHGVTCYVARASDSHAMQMQCLKTQ
jgi:catabolite regulation protein CreA